MGHNPLRLIVAGYGLIALIAGVLGWFGVGWGHLVLLVWLGGPVVVLSLPFAPHAGRLFRRSDREAKDDEVASSLGRLEQDRLVDDQQPAGHAHHAGASMVS